jgi:hypothetical protein
VGIIGIIILVVILPWTDNGNITSGGDYHPLTSVQTAKNWQNISTGYLTGGNISVYRNISTGYLTGGNLTVTWDNISIGYLTGGNISVYQNISSGYSSGYLTGGNISTFKNISTGYLTGGNITISWNNISTGYLTGGNISVYQNISTGYLTGGNISVIKNWQNISTGYLTGGNATVTWDNISTGYLTGGNISTYRNISTGWLTGGHVSLRSWLNYSTGYLTGGNITQTCYADFSLTIEGSSIICTSIDKCMYTIDKYRWNITSNEVSIGSTGWIADPSGVNHIFTIDETNTYLITHCINTSQGEYCITKGTDILYPEKDKYDAEFYKNCKSCEDAGYYWYDDSCHEDDEPLPWNVKEELPEAKEKKDPEIDFLGYKVDIRLILFFIIIGVIIVVVLNKKKKKKRT